MSEDLKDPEWLLHQGGGSLGTVSLEEVVELFSGTQDFFLYLDDQGCILYINQIFSEYSPVENVLGLPASAFVTDASKPLYEAALEAAKQERKIQVFEAEAVIGAWVLGRVYPVFREDVFSGHLLFLTDLTSFKATQLELERANMQLANRVDERDLSLAQESERRERLEEHLVDAQKLESLGALAGGVAHEYNNLLTVVLGNAGLAQMLLPENSPAREAIKHLETATVHAAELTNQLLTFSGHAKVKPETLNLSQAIAELATLMEAILPLGKALELSCDPDLPLVLGDLGQMQQVLMHLVRYSADRMGSNDGAIRIETGSASLEQDEIEACYLEGMGPGEYVYLRVSHDGPALSKAQRTHFFEPFSPYSPGVQGLGIAAALGIVRSYGGTARVTSSRESTRITLYFPADLGVVDAKEEGAVSQWVLLVDDDFAVRDTMESLLTYLGYEVFSVDTCQSATEYFQGGSAPVSIVLLGGHVCDSRSLECFDSIREMIPHLPVVVMSEISDEAVSEAFEGRDLQAVLKKPFRFPDLERIVREALSSP